MTTNKTVAPIVAQTIAILTATSCNTVKTFYLDAERRLKCQPYGKETHFTYKLYAVHGIEHFATLLTALSKQKNTILIRGFPRPQLHRPAERLGENFPEAPAGCQWVMLDFDDLLIPEGINPNSIEAIEHIISKLPKEFHNVSYFYQFSSSAGILDEDGNPLKSGLNAHVFFWLKRPITGNNLSAYLELHCYDTNFFLKTHNRSGMPVIKVGVDLSVIRSSVQPHYIGLPILGAGVVCTLPSDARQGLEKKNNHAAELPEMPSTIIAQAVATRKRIRDGWKAECGFVPARITTRAAHGGISVSTYHRNPNVTSPNGDRDFLEAKPYGENAVILYFYGETSPGSYFVKKASPQLAIRFGDFDSISLKELSEVAFAHIRDELGWFSEISHVDLELDDAGHMPTIQSFARARNNLVISPTGSGKSTAFCKDVDRQFNPVVGGTPITLSKAIIYVAQTRALVRQMYDDLTKWNGADGILQQGIRTIHYSKFFKNEMLKAGVVYVTTNESLPKFIESALAQGIEYDLVVDEVHAAVDDFMASEWKNRIFEKAIGRAGRSFFMTGTITNLQVTKLIDTISRACGGLTAEMFTSYQFHPVKSNPLFIANVSDFGADFVALLRKYQELKKDGKPIPRSVFIMSTTKMRAFKNLLKAFGLEDDSLVASRQESTEKEIELAQVSRKPILVSSPIFALGMNFENPPAVFWTLFSYLQVDESQIIQTLNRANRGQVTCEVRLYIGVTDELPVMIPPAELEAMKIEEYFRDEASVQGLLDGHFHVDRVTYNILREAEKKTGKSLYRLIENDCIQNYHVVHDWIETLDAGKDCKEIFSKFKAEARESYLEDVYEQADSYESFSDSMLLQKLEALYDERQSYSDEDKPVPRELEACERGLAVLICDVTAEQSDKVKPGRIRRLFGDLLPFMSTQYSRDRSDEWKAAAAEKILALIPLLKALKRLSDGELNGHSFGALMKRTSLGQAVKALADHERSYFDWQGKLERLEEISNLIRTKASADQKVKLRAEQFAIAQDFLATIGVNFEVEEVEKEKFVNPENPTVPDWDFDLMIATLERKAASLKRLPSTPLNFVNEHEGWIGADVSIELCAGCVHCDRDFLCAVGRPIQPFWMEGWAVTEKCDAYYKIPARLAAWKPTKNENMVGSGFD